MEKIMEKVYAVDDQMGKKIKERRGELGMSQRDLAIRSGFTHSYISKMEGGYQRVESRSLRIIADTLRVSVDWLLDKEGKSSKSVVCEWIVEDEKELLHLLRELPIEYRKSLIAQARGLNDYLARKAA